MTEDKEDKQTALLGCLVEPDHKKAFQDIAKRKHTTVSMLLRQMIMKLIEKEAKK